MNIKEAAALVYGESADVQLAEIIFDSEAARSRRRALESRAETERMRIKLFESEGNAWLQKAFWAKKRLSDINDELKTLEAL